MALRHAAAGFMGAEQSFNRIRGYKHVSVLVAMLEVESVDQSAIGTAWFIDSTSYSEQFYEFQIPRS